MTGKRNRLLSAKTIVACVVGSVVLTLASGYATQQASWGVGPRYIGLPFIVSAHHGFQQGESSYTVWLYNQAIFETPLVNLPGSAVIWADIFSCVLNFIVCLLVALLLSLAYVRRRRR